MAIMTVSRAPIWLGLALALTTEAAPAWACGGCFVPPINSGAPILQNAERVLFVRDAATKKSTVWVEVRYSGPADGFGWVLPLPKQPKVGVGSSYLFDRLQLATGPRYVLDSLPSEGCGGGGGSSGFGGCASDSAASFASEGTSAKSGGRGSTVTVLQHDQVGPYDYQVISGSDLADIQKWLSDNGFAIPDKAKAVLADHVKLKNVFVAVKLATGKGVEEIKPIALEMDDAEPCVPLRLTSIAAVEDTTVQVYVAGPGRAIPKNHLHVRINPMRLDVLHGAANYEQVLAAAIDEAAGRAFVTEFSGALPKTVEIPSPYPYGEATTEPLVDLTALDLSGMYKLTGKCAVVGFIHSHKLPITKETAAILEKHLDLVVSADSAAAVNYYRGDNVCVEPAGAPAFDPKPLADQLEKEFAKPLRDMAKALGDASSGGGATGRLTRLAMRISPEEMTKDPVFAFNATLPDVSNITKGAWGPVCLGNALANGYRVTIGGIGSWIFGNQTNADGSNIPNIAVDPRFKSAPAALAVELLDETGDPKPIDKGDIATVDQAIAGAHWGAPSLPTGLQLKSAAPRWSPPASDAAVTRASNNSSACSGDRQAPLGRALTLLTLLGGALWVVARRKNI